MEMAHVIAVAGIFDMIPLSDVDYRWKGLDRDLSGSKRATERGQAEGIGKARELHCQSCCKRRLNLFQ